MFASHQLVRVDVCSLLHRTSGAEFDVNVGDIVLRRIPERGSVGLATAIDQKERLGMGLVLSKRMSGFPAHPCVSVYYPRVGKIYEIAESLMEVISASR